MSVGFSHVFYHCRSLILTIEYNFIWTLCCNLSILILDRHVDSFLIWAIKNSDPVSDFYSEECLDVPRSTIAGSLGVPVFTITESRQFSKVGDANLDAHQ